MTTMFDVHLLPPTGKRGAAQRLAVVPAVMVGEIATPDSAHVRAALTNNALKRAFDRSEWHAQNGNSDLLSIELTGDIGWPLGYLQARPIETAA